MSVKEEAARCIAKGLRVVPLKPRMKEPYETGWNAGGGTDLIFQPEDFGDDDNIGIRSIDGVIVIDVDAAEAVACADAFLPKTGLIYGRPSKPRSKRLYLSSFERMVTFRDAEDKTLIEIRTRHHDMSPCSTHPDGEVLAWEVFEDNSSVDRDVLERCVRLVATCALVVKSYAGDGARHDWGLAWWGTLRHLGLTEVECTKVAQEAGRIAGDKKVLDRVTEVRSTYARGDDSPIKSEGALREKTSKQTVDALKHVWGLTHRNVHGFRNHPKTGATLANDQDNIKLALKKLKVELTYNEFSHKPIARMGGHEDAYHGVLDDEQRDALWLTIDAKFGFRPSPEFFDTVIKATCKQHKFHPVRDYLKSVTWDGTPRLDTWLITYAGAADNDYVRAVSRLPLLAAVRRVMAYPSPIKFDEMLVLESGQGKGKSTALGLLCPFESWFTDDLPLNVDSKQVIERTTGKWIIEAAELAGGRRADAEHIKSFLSRRVDGPVRLAYERLSAEVARQFVIIGTTNSHAYLKDMVNRRFWPVRVDNVWHLEALARDRDQLWAEAFFRERRGESIRMDSNLWHLAELQQERRRVGDPWETGLQALWGLEVRDTLLRLTWEDVWQALGLTELAQRTSEDMNRASAVLQQLGFRRLRVKGKKTTDNPRPTAEMGWGWDPPQAGLLLEE
jgi:predicted P-loop ATPase